MMTTWGWEVAGAGADKPGLILPPCLSRDVLGIKLTGEEKGY